MIDAGYDPEGMISVMRRARSQQAVDNANQNSLVRIQVPKIVFRRFKTQSKMLPVIVRVRR